MRCLPAETVEGFWGSPGVWVCRGLVQWLLIWVSLPHGPPPSTSPPPPAAEPCQDLYHRKESHSGFPEMWKTSPEESRRAHGSPGQRRWRHECLEAVPPGGLSLGALKDPTPWAPRNAGSIKHNICALPSQANENAQRAGVDPLK